ncbi:hypothetical protein BH11BAC3_BH11BAC3_07400 [soil metagenome]
MMIQKTCLWCGGLLDGSHGNRNYCDDVCSYSQKKYQTNKKYWDQKSALEAFKKADELLGIFYKKYGSAHYIQAILLDTAEMDWAIIKKEIIVEGFPVKVLGNFGYCLFKNETLRIWNIPQN